MLRDESGRKSESLIYFFCCDVTRGESDTFVMYHDSFMVQQRPLYCVSSLSASYCNHNLTTTLAQPGWEKEAAVLLVMQLETR